MTSATNIYLIGPMGSGKSAVGVQLAREIALGFIDSDAEIESRTGVDIAYIFEREGEAGFREREKCVIEELTARRGILMATGGGAIMDARNRERLAATGTVVYLMTDVDEQLKRTNRTRKRPLLHADDPRAVLERLMAVRKPLYESIADVSLDTTGLRVRTVVARLRELLRQHCARPLQS